MTKVAVYSALLVAGLVVGQLVAGLPALPIRIVTTICLAFVMIHVGYEFDLDKSRPRAYARDYLVAFTAAAFPWMFVALYFVFLLAPPALWFHPDLWKETLLQARFAAPTSAGVLFSMLAAAGLSATWVFRKARILAIFDDLDTILLMVPLKILLVGNRWQLWTIVAAILGLLVLAWRYLHRVPLPITWPWVMTYAVLISGASEILYVASTLVDPLVPIHLEVLLPAFVLGCMLARPPGADPHRDDERVGHQEGPESEQEQRVSTYVSGLFMLCVGLSMPPFTGGTPVASSALAFSGVSPDVLASRLVIPSVGMLFLHVLAVSLVANLGKMFPVFCYRDEAPLRHRLAVAIGMWPRGEVGAGVLIVSMSYGIGGPALAVAVLSLALNLLLTGVFILAVKRLVAGPAALARLGEAAGPST